MSIRVMDENIASQQVPGDTDGHEKPGHDAGREHGRDTRSRLRELALEMFAEQGYEKTSLREIAERLGVTKAALYYYFKSKEDIVASLIEDYVSELDELIDWAKGQPRSAETRTAIVRKYLDIVANGSAVFRMLHQNQASVSGLATTAKERSQLFRERMDTLIDLLSEGSEEPLRARIRAAACLMSLSFCWMHYQDTAPDTDKLRAAVLDVGLELADANPS
jgi:AcrR family transcriptional regulator